MAPAIEELTPVLLSPTAPVAAGFDAAARAVLAYLQEHVPLAFWSVTRVENGRQTYLYLEEDNGYGLPRGSSHPWEDSFCIHMAAGAAPDIALDAQAVPAYAAAGVNRAVTIGSYAGAVISEPDGSVFGAICGIDPKVRSDDPALSAAAPILRLLGCLLTMVLAADRALDEVARAEARARSEAETDALTGLLNRRAWERLITLESARFTRLADPTVVVMLDLDGLKALNDEQGHAAGDAHLQAAAQALSTGVRQGDAVARLGGDEFAVLLNGCTEELAPTRLAQIERKLAEKGVSGSLGWAPIRARTGFDAALAEADAAMYAAKQSTRVKGGDRRPVRPRSASTGS